MRRFSAYCALTLLRFVCPVSKLPVQPFRSPARAANILPPYRLTKMRFAFENTENPCGAVFSSPRWGLRGYFLYFRLFSEGSRTTY